MFSLEIAFSHLKSQIDPTSDFRIRATRIPDECLQIQFEISFSLSLLRSHLLLINAQMNTIQDETKTS